MVYVQVGLIAAPKCQSVLYDEAVQQGARHRSDTAPNTHSGCNATVATADARGALGGAACGAGSQEHSGLMPSYCAYVSDKICFRVFSST